MSTKINVERNELHLPNLVPNKAKVQDLTLKTNQLQNAVNEVRRSFQPDLEPSKTILIFIYTLL